MCVIGIYLIYLILALMCVDRHVVLYLILALMCVISIPTVSIVVL
jgi:hypothetical protein